MLDASGRDFQMAVQLAMLEQRDEIAAIANAAQFADRSAWRLFRRHLANYFAAALLMPYGRFLRGCEATGYDLPLLQRRFGVGFEQLAHRLTTMHRVGQRGLPFFMARIDRAGQFSKRLAASSGTLMLESEGTCPRLAAYQAFADRGRLRVQRVELADASGNTSDWVLFSQSVGSHAGGTFSAEYVVILGLETRLAGQVTLAHDADVSANSVAKIGMGCARCFREACHQRAVPPRGAGLVFDERVRGLSAFAIKG